MNQEVTYHREVLGEYQRIAEHNNAQKISFYKNNEQRISNIPINERIDIVLDFHEALFSNGEYQEYLDRVDAIVEALFDSDVFPSFDKKSLYTLLFNKAKCLYNLHHIEESEHTLQMLVKMDAGKSDICKLLLERIFRKKRELSKFKSRGIVIALILGSAILSIWSVFVIDPFYPEQLTGYRIAVVSLFILGCGIWIGTLLYHGQKSKKEAEEFMINHSRNKKYSSLV